MQVQDISVPDVENPIGQQLVTKLNGLGIYGIEIGDPIVGPIITGFPIVFKRQIPLKKFNRLEEDLAFACEVDSVEIKRIGGKFFIFIPNKEKTIVDFKDSLAWFMKDEKVKEMALPILLGVDAEGCNAAIDLTEQPHILIAGSTGSGKSIFESAIISSLAVKLSPDQLQFYLVDTKNLDLTLFKDLPHVMTIVEDTEHWYPEINFLYSEVQRRNILIKEQGCRNIKEYNLKVEKKIPYIILVIDELADLIEKDRAAREERKFNEEDEDAEPKAIKAIQRIIQVSRASGIHIIACTQRSSADVVSPVVKANFPTRIALKLPQFQDSVVILGEKGAEKLLGSGDMLVNSANDDMTKRYHAPFVKVNDIINVIKFPELIRRQFQP